MQRLLKSVLYLIAAHLCVLIFLYSTSSESLSLQTGRPMGYFLLFLIITKVYRAVSRNRNTARSFGGSQWQKKVHKSSVPLGSPDQTEKGKHLLFIIKERQVLRHRR